MTVTVELDSDKDLAFLTSCVLLARFHMSEDEDLDRVLRLCQRLTDARQGCQP